VTPAGAPVSAAQGKRALSEGIRARPTDSVPTTGASPFKRFVLPAAVGVLAVVVVILAVRNSQQSTDSDGQGAQVASGKERDAVSGEDDDGVASKSGDGAKVPAAIVDAGSASAAGRDAAAARSAVMVRVNIESTPSGASIVRADDGSGLGTTPWSGELERAEAPVALVLQRRGYEDLAVEVDVGKNVRESYTLVKKHSSDQGVTKDTVGKRQAKRLFD
jgi:hypothetical protein